MKSIETLYSEVLENDELKKAFTEAFEKKQLEVFLKDNNCDASLSDVQAFLAEQQNKEGAISDAELNGASGGCSTKEALLSVTTAGIYCLVDTSFSIAQGQLGDENSGKLLCPYT